MDASIFTQSESVYVSHDPSGREPSSELPEHKHNTKIPSSKVRSLWYTLMGVVTLFFILSVVGIMMLFPPRSFPSDTIIHIEAGQPLSVIADTLYADNIVRSSRLLQLVMKATGTASSVKAGDYHFEAPLNLFALASRISRGEYGDVFVHVTIPEGSSLEEIASIAEKKLVDFNADYFFSEALSYNGYLFPDTYFLLPTTSEDEFLTILHDEFSDKLQTIIPNELVDVDPADLREKVIMASILEREANDENDMYIISGILWKRIEIGMPLQVDASFAYLLNKESSEVTMDDINLDSPFNTYKYKGLPPSPLGNPGSLALDAAFHPAVSPYLYYLHDPSGQVHFARTFKEHVQNKNKYLR